MSKILAVFGATGQQGSSIINYVLNDSELSRSYKIRAVTRDVGSEKVKELKKQVEVVQGDLRDRASIEKALTGAHTIFAMTPPYFEADAFDFEYNGIKTIADVAVEKNAQYIIFSTLPSPAELSGGKYTNIVQWEVKAKSEQYICSLPIKSAFYAPAFFMQNLHAHPFLGPQKASDGTWVLTRHISPKAQIPMIDPLEDSGKFVGAILADPDKYEGKTFFAAAETHSWEDMAAIISKASGKTVVAKQVSVEEWKKSLPPPAAEILTEMFSYYGDPGYYGLDSEKLVAWAAENARGNLTSFEKFLQAHPFQLE